MTRFSPPLLPTLRFAWLSSLAVPLALVGIIAPAGRLAAGAYGLLLFAAAAADGWLAGNPALASVTRSTPTRGALGHPLALRLRVHWAGKRLARLRLRDVTPASFDSAADEMTLRIEPSRTAECAHEARPRERGVQVFGPVALRTTGPLGLVERTAEVPAPATVRIDPDLPVLAAGDAALTAPSRATAGRRPEALRGEGREFHQLRDYVPGDDLRSIDWKAFAHRGRPAVRETRLEANQRVLLLLDAGRLMTVGVGDRVRFDWAAQAAGRIARTALAVGDAVGLAVFGRGLQSFVPPSRHHGQWGRLAETLCTARPELDDSDLGPALRRLLRGASRRTLVVVFTELGEPRAAEALLRDLGRLARRHLGLVVTLADADLDAARSCIPATAEQAWRRTAAEEVWQEQQRVQSTLESRGCFVVRARADALAGDTVERYLEIKRRGLL